MIRAFLSLSVALCVCGVFAPPRAGMPAAEARGQSRPGRTLPGEVKSLGSGKLLVASRMLRDPNFVETVVLLVDFDKDGAAGLIVNVQTDVSLSRVFDDVSLGANATVMAFAGGPVARSHALALVRSRPGAAGVRTIVPGVDLASTRERLEETLTSVADRDRFRVFLGRAGWGPGQLERETERGAWHVFDAQADLVFDPHPDTVWRRLIRLVELPQA